MLCCRMSLFSKLPENMSSYVRPFIVIREYRPADDIACRELIKNYVMSFATGAFVSCLFREVSKTQKKNKKKIKLGLIQNQIVTKHNFISFRQIFIQLIVLVAALMFIFLGVPLMFCLASVPIVCIILFGSVYTTYFGKAMDLASQPMHTAWVAEAYEPFLLSLTNHQQRAFNIVQEDSILPNDIEVNRMRRQIVGFVSIGPHKGMDNSGWLNRLSIMSKYSFDKVAEPLIQRVLKHGHDQHLDSIEATTTECQFDNRELLLKMGFGMKQIYHKQVLGSNSLRVMKSQLGIDLRTWSVSKNK